MTKHTLTPDSITAAKALVSRLCENGHIRMSVPVDFARDEDMLICALIDVAEKSLVTPTPAASGAAPAEFEPWLRTICITAPPPQAYDLAKQAWAQGMKRGAALASREAQHSPAPLTDEQIASAYSEIYASDYPARAAYDLAIGRAVLALASPQVAPAQRNTMRAFEAWYCSDGNYEPEELDKLVGGACYANADTENMWQAWQGAFIRLATPVQVAPQPTPYVDSNPQLHVGESSFEDWYQNYLPNSVGHKQIARDAYAAGMGDPLVVPQDDARDAAEETCDRCNGSGDQEYLVGGGPDAHDETGPCSKCGGSGVMPRGVPVEALIAAIKHQIKHAKDKRVQLAPSFWGHDRGAGLPLSELEDVILEWESQGGCEVPPPGWWCSRVKGHDGPCAARPVTLSTPAAKPTEPTLPTQGEQSHD